MYGKESLENKITQKGLCLKKDCVMNMTARRHEYKGVDSGGQSAAYQQVDCAR